MLMNVLDLMRVDMEPLARIKKALTVVHVHQKLFLIQILTSSALESSLAMWKMTVQEMLFVILKNVACVLNQTLEMTVDVSYFINFNNLTYYLFITTSKIQIKYLF